MLQGNEFDKIAYVAKDRHAELLEEAKRWQLLNGRPGDGEGKRNWWQWLRQALERFHGGHQLKPAQPRRPAIQH